MRTYCIVGTAWETRRDLCLNLVLRDLRVSPRETLSLNIDESTVAREIQLEKEALRDATLREIDFCAWVNEALTEERVVNIEAIRRDAYSVRVDHLVAINAIGFQSEIIEKALTQFRVGLYSQPDWPQAIVLACDNAQRFQVGPALANMFYIRPNVVTKAAIGRQVRSLLLDADLLRLFGQGIGSAPRILRGINNWIFARREKRRAKEYGWVWEE